MDDSEILYRQINPSWIEDGQPTSQGFRPTPKDENKLSGDRASIFAPRQSYELHTITKNLKSAGTYGVSVGEFASEKIVCTPDPIKDCEGEHDNPAHAIADFSPHATAKHKNISKRLRNCAVARGCYFPAAHDQPPTPSS